MPRLEAKDAAARASNPLGRDFSEALHRGLQVLTAFGPNAQALTLSDIARHVGQPRATVRRALLTLAHLGYVREEGRLFSLTPRVLQLAASYLGASYAGTRGPVIPAGLVPLSASTSDLGYWPRSEDRVWTAGASLYVGAHLVLKGDYQWFQLNQGFRRFDLGLGVSF